MIGGKGRGNGTFIDLSITHWLERLGLIAWIDKKVESLSKGLLWLAEKYVQFISVGPQSS